MPPKIQNDVKAYRTISIGENNVVSVPSDEGAPQYVLRRLLNKCVSMTEEFNELKKGKTSNNIPSTQLYQFSDVKYELETHLKSAGRDEWGNKANKLKDKFNFLYDLAIQHMKTSSVGKQDMDRIIIEMFAEGPLIKSVSDLDQLKALIFGIPQMISNEKHDTTGWGGKNIAGKLSICPEMIMISSDKIAASLCAMVADGCPYPFHIMCSRKVGSQTQSILIQKNHVSMLAILINLLMNNTADNITTTGFGYIQKIIASRTNLVTQEFNDIILDICGILYNSDSQEDATKIIDIVDSIFAEVSPTERGGESNNPKNTHTPYQ